MYIYRLYDESKEIIYVGKTTLERIELRIRTHFSNYKRYNLESFWRRYIRYYDYVKLNNEYELEMYETFYINKHQTNYNKSKKFDCSLTIELPKLNFSKLQSVQAAGVDLDYYLKIYENKINELRKDEKQYTISLQKQREIFKKMTRCIPLEIQKLFNSIKKNKKLNWSRNLLVMKLSICYGLKLSEIVNLNLEDINFIEQTLTIKRNDTEYLIPLSKKIIKLLKKHIDEFGIQNDNSPLFISTRGNRVNHRTLQIAIKKYSSNSNINKLTLRRLRMIFIKNLINASEQNLQLVKNITELSEGRINSLLLNDNSNHYAWQSP